MTFAPPKMHFIPAGFWSRFWPRLRAALTATYQDNCLGLAKGVAYSSLLSFFPVPEVVSTFQQTIFPVGGNQLSSKPPSGPVITELDPNNLPEDFPFDLSERGLGEGGPGESRELTMTERLIGMTNPDDPPPSIGPENVIDPRAPKKPE